MRKIPVKLASLIVCFGCAAVGSQVFGQLPAAGSGPGGGAQTTATVDFDPGTIVSTQSTVAGKENFWATRQTDGRATVIRVFKDGNTLYGILGVYKLNGGPFSTNREFIRDKFQLTFNTSTVVSEYDMMRVRLDYDTTKSRYDVVLLKNENSPAPPIDAKIGTIQFLGGKAGRKSSDVILRFNKVGGAGAGAVINAKDPCSEPADLGQEEELEIDAATQLPESFEQIPSN